MPALDYYLSIIESLGRSIIILDNIRNTIF